MRIIKTVAVVAIASLVLVFLSLTPAHAQTATSPGFAAQISPLPILLNVKPGNSVGTDLRVNNPSAHPETLKVVVKTFTQDGPNGLVSLHDPTPDDSFINWIHFSKTTFAAPPGLWQTIHMTVDVPATAKYGYYFAVEFTSANPPQASTGNSTNIQGAVASFVLLNAQAQGELQQLEVSSFTADHKSYEFLPVNFTIRIHNSGNIFAGASGNIFILQGKKQVGVLTINSNHGLVLPNSNRVFTTAWSAGFPVYQTIYGPDGQPQLNQNGQPKTKLSWNLGQASKLRFGHYTAKLDLIYNNGQTDVPITGSVSFWVIPWRIIGVVLILVIAIPLLALLLIRSRQRVKLLEKELAGQKATKK